jgi:hypothetical protein
VHFVQHLHPGPADLGPNLYLFQPNVKKNYAFLYKVLYALQNTENFDTYDTRKKDKTI